MHCPKCGSTMEKVTYQAVEVDRCTGCNGLWFDLREHVALKAAHGARLVDTGDAQVGKRFNAAGDVQCPLCATSMTRVVDPRQPHIWYESCPVCYGVFFDAGEFRDYSHETLLDTIKDLFAGERQ